MLLHGANPCTGNTQQPSVQVCKAVAQHVHTTQQRLLHVVPPSTRNTQQAALNADWGMEARRQRVLAILAENPGDQRAYITDTGADPEAVILTLAIRGQATCELEIPREKWDGVLFLELLERHFATVH